MLTIEVKRHSQGEPYFEPWIERFEDGRGRRFHFHWDDISDEGAAWLREVYIEQARRWHPRPPDMPRGRKIPVTMERRPVMPCGVPIAVDDRAEYIAYMVRSDLISERGARAIARIQSETSPHWVRRPHRRQVQLRAV